MNSENAAGNAMEIETLRRHLATLYPLTAATRWQLESHGQLDRDLAAAHGLDLLSPAIQEAPAEILRLRAEGNNLGAVVVILNGTIVGTFILMADIGLSLVSSWKGDYLTPFRRVTFAPDFSNRIPPASDDLPEEDGDDADDERDLD